jgi:hypothetical protein
MECPGRSGSQSRSRRSSCFKQLSSSWWPSGGWGRDTSSSGSSRTGHHTAVHCSCQGMTGPCALLQGHQQQQAGIRQRGPPSAVQPQRRGVDAPGNHAAAVGGKSQSRISTLPAIRQQSLLLVLLLLLYIGHQCRVRRSPAAACCCSWPHPLSHPLPLATHTCGSNLANSRRPDERDSRSMFFSGLHGTPGMVQCQHAVTSNTGAMARGLSTGEYGDSTVLHTAAATWHVSHVRAVIQSDIVCCGGWRVRASALMLDR